MSFFRKAGLALAVFISFSCPAQEKPEANVALDSLQTLRQGLRSGTLDYLQQSFAALKSQNLLTPEEAATLSQVNEALLKNLNDPKADPKRAALQYLVLNNYLDIVRLMLESAEISESTHLARAKNLYSLIFVRVLSEDALSTLQAAVFPLAQEAEKDFVEAQGMLRKAKALENVQDLTLQVRNLFSIEDNEANHFAFGDLLEAKRQFEAGQEAHGTNLVEKALHRIFPQAEQRFDNRHLRHLLKLRVITGYLGKSASLSSLERNDLVARFAALSNAKEEAEYTRISQNLEKQTLNLLKAHPSLQSEIGLIVRVNPLTIQRSLVLELRQLRLGLPEVRKRFKKNQNFIQGFEYRTNAKGLEAIKTLDSSLENVAKRLETNTSPEMIENVYRSRSLIRLTLDSALTSILNRSETFSDYATFLSYRLLGLSGSHPFLNEKDIHNLRWLMDREKEEAVFQAWVNRRTVSVGAMSLALVAEAIAIPFSGGASATAMPATLQAITSATLVGSRAVMVGTSALNIADRAKAKGPAGLANLDTAFDALVILSLSPRAIPGGPPASTRIGRWGQGALTTLSQFQYSAGITLAWGGPAYGGYLLMNADSLASELDKDGVSVTPAEIRRRGLIYLALGVISASENHLYYQRGKSEWGKAFETDIEPGTLGSSLKGLGRIVNPYGAAKEAYNANPGALGLAKAVGLGLVYGSEAYILGNEIILLSYTTLDSHYLNVAQKRHPFPELQGDETAVILVGFDKADPLLYHGARTYHSNRREYSQYGNKVFLYDYTDPDDFVRILSRHRREKGPIKYLKIATHGRPGQLYTRAVHSSPEDAPDQGWLGTPWLRENRATLTALGRDVFAPGARVVLWSCLSGANLKNKLTDAPVDRKGDDFLETFGDVLLPNGGAIDASTRILVGFDATIGSFAYSSLRDSFKTEPAVFEEPPDENQAWLAVDLGDNKKQAIEAAKFMGTRFVKMVLQMPWIWYQYGVSLEGPWWGSRFKYLEVKRH